MSDPRTSVRDLAIGVSVALGALGLVFFGTVGLVDTIVLTLTVVILIWVSTTDARRLVDEQGRPALMLFGLGGLGVALIFTSAVLISSVTEYLALAVASVAWFVGLFRAFRFGWGIQGREP
ncbi:MAG: MFS transporter [Acidimicrobiia bacterium]